MLAQGTVRIQKAGLAAKKVNSSHGRNEKKRSAKGLAEKQVRNFTKDISYGKLKFIITQAYTDKHPVNSETLLDPAKIL